MMCRISVFLPAAVAVLLLLPSPAAADGLRCGMNLVRSGDRMFEVKQVCGEPDLRVVLYSAIVDEVGVLPYGEEWQYNFGPQRFMRFLRFRGGRLREVRTGSYGFHKRQSDCTPAELKEGLSQLALLARCGKADIVERYVTRHGYRYEFEGPFYPAGLPAEDWIYHFGDGRFYRIVTLINGRVVRVETSDSRG